MEEKWRSFLTKKISSLFDTEFKQAQAEFDWNTANDDLRIYSASAEPLPEVFIRKTKDWLSSSKLNSFRGLEAYAMAEVIFGCTQFIEDFQIVCKDRRLRYSHFDYSFYWNIGDQKHVFIEEAPLTEGDALLLSCPFTFEGDLHPQFNQLLDECLRLKIPVFLDCAWVGTCKNISVDFSHPAIWALGFSLSKGLGLGDQRIGIRLKHHDFGGPIAELNRFNYLPYIQMHLGLHMMAAFSVDHLQMKYGDLQIQICKKLGLKPTKCIHLAHGAMKDWADYAREDSERPIIGTARLLRAIHENRFQ